MEILIPKECKEHPGFYHVPGNDIVVVSPDGKFINLRTGKFIKPGPINDAYWKISINFQGSTLNYYIHRLMALTFIGRPNRHLDKKFEDLEVIHIDGDKSNNTLTNFEWLTPSENSKHAILNFLWNKKVVMARHILNDSVMLFPSITECAKQFNLSVKRFTRHLRSKSAGTLTKKWFVFKFDDGSPWPFLDSNDHEENKWDVMYGAWYATNVKDGRIVIGNTLERLAAELGLFFSSVQTHYVRSEKGTPFKDWIFKYDDKPLLDVVGSLPRRSLPDKVRESMPLIFRSTTSDEILRFDSITKAAKYFNVYSPRLLYALNKQNGVFKDYKIEKDIISQ
jgi:hypothetical protein